MEQTSGFRGTGFKSGVSINDIIDIFISRYNHHWIELVIIPPSSSCIQLSLHEWDNIGCSQKGECKLLVLETCFMIYTSILYQAYISKH